MSGANVHRTRMGAATGRAAGRMLVTTTAPRTEIIGLATISAQNARTPDSSSSPAALAALAAAQQEPDGDWQDIALALARQIGPDRSAADAALKTLIDKWAGAAPYQIAEVYALRNDAKETFAWLDRAWINRDPGITLVLFDPFILRYKDDPRFAAFCKKVGLPTPAEVGKRT